MQHLFLVSIFRIFFFFYDIKFGRRKVPARDATDNGDSVQNGNSSTMNGNGSVRNTAELSIFEQYNQVFWL